MSFQAPCQGAPSTIRCIKTAPGAERTTIVFYIVREHPAPSGALRLAAEGVLQAGGQQESGSTQHHQVH